MAQKKKFPSADLIKINPDKLFTSKSTVKDENDLICAFITILAVYFNDLKDLSYFDKWNREYESPPKDEATSHAGEFSGINNHLNRLLVSLIFELTECIKTNKGILESKKFKHYESKLNPVSKVWWGDLKRFSLNEFADSSKATDFQKFLLLVRNNVAAHVQNPKIIIEGYNEHFYNKTGEGGDKELYAFYSYDSEEYLGNRFYFADAVTGAYFRKQAEKVGKTQDVWNRTVEWSVEVSKVLADLVSIYLKEKPEVK